jgi:hypothetical protein
MVYFNVSKNWLLGSLTLNLILDSLNIFAYNSLNVPIVPKVKHILSFK